MTTLVHPGATGVSVGDIAPAPETDKTRRYPCEACGAELEFSIGQQTLACTYCGHSRTIELPEEGSVDEQDLHAVLRRVAQQKTQDGAAVGDREVTCNSCAGTVVFSGNLTSTSCSYCGAPVQRDDVHEAKSRVPPDGVLPFLVEREQARSNVKRWVASRWFAPSSFKARGAAGDFAGVYLPYWTFDAMTSCRYTGERGEHYYVTEGSGDNKRKVRKTRWERVWGRFQRFFDDVLVAATSRLPAKLLEALEPWPFERLIPFTPEVMAGYLAHAYDVELETGLDRAKGKIESALRSDVRRRIGGDEQRIHSMDVLYAGLTFKHLMLPVWLLSYRFSDKTYRVVVNACTGEVYGERPWSVAKILLTVVAVGAVIAAIVIGARLAEGG
jgi:DNA-directed RNA polymerase subunit RPC12/RpoP